MQMFFASKSSLTMNINTNLIYLPNNNLVIKYIGFYWGVSSVGRAAAS